MSEWKEYKLGELLQVKGYVRGPFGSALKRRELLDEGIPVYEQQHAIYNKRVFRFFINEAKYEEMRRFTVQTDDIIISCSGTVGEVSIIKENDPKGIISQALLLLRVDPELVLPNYLLFFLKSKNGHNAIVSCSSGSVQINIAKREVIENIPLSLPSITEQNKIVAVLSSLDDKIDLLRRENATLEAMAETLFRQWFVVEAKEEWEEGKLGDYVDETIGGEWGKEAPEGDNNMPVCCIRGADIADLKSGLANRTPVRYIKQTKFEKIRPKTGDLILEISGGTDTCSTGRVAYINNGVAELFAYPIVFSNFCRLLRVKNGYSFFLYCYFWYLHGQNELFNLENGSSGIHNLDYKALLYDLTYPMPNDKRRIMEFNDKVSIYFEKVNRNKQQIQTLIQTRDGLLPRLMGGEIRV